MLIPICQSNLAELILNINNNRKQPRINLSKSISVRFLALFETSLKGNKSEATTEREAVYTRSDFPLHLHSELSQLVMKFAEMQEFCQSKFWKPDTVHGIVIEKTHICNLGKSSLNVDHQSNMTDFLSSSTHQVICLRKVPFFIPPPKKSFLRSLTNDILDSLFCTVYEQHLSMANQTFFYQEEGSGSAICSHWHDSISK